MCSYWGQNLNRVLIPLFAHILKGLEVYKFNKIVLLQVLTL